MDPSISAGLNGLHSPEMLAHARTPGRKPVGYPEREWPSSDGPARNRWAREATLSVIDRTAPVLLDDDVVAMVLDSTPAPIDRRIWDGKIELEDCASRGRNVVLTSMHRRDQISPPRDGQGYQAHIRRVGHLNSTNVATRLKIVERYV